MGYLPHTGGLSKTPHLIVIDAVLTELGRFRLAEGAGNFNITKFALGDDEIDYSLYDSSQATDNQDDLIMITPVLEAVPDSVVGIRHFLYTAPPPENLGPLSTQVSTPGAMSIAENSTGLISVKTNNAVEPDNLYTVKILGAGAKVFDIQGDNIVVQPQLDDLVKVWTVSSIPGGNSATVSVFAKTPQPNKNPIDGISPILDTDQFTFVVEVTGQTNGNTSSTEVTWFRDVAPPQL